MVDTVDGKTRSKIMSNIRSKGNKSTELKFRMIMVRAGISGWCVHPKDITGNPDFAFPGFSTAIFVDGCFWHGCPVCGHIPKSNSKYWQIKILRNIERDKKLRSQLQVEGWKVIQFWEHGLANSHKVLSTLKIVIPNSSFCNDP